MTRGGAGRGQGRKPLSGDEPMIRKNIVLTHEDLAYLTMIDSDNLSRAVREVIGRDRVMATRKQQIEQIAGIINENLINSLTGYTMDQVRARAKAINERDGWTFETSGATSRSCIRHEGVSLTGAELEQAIQLAEQWNA